MTKLEKKAALAVLGLAAGVTVAGVKLLKKHAVYVAKRSAAFFKDEEEPLADRTGEVTEDENRI